MAEQEWQPKMAGRPNAQDVAFVTATANRYPKLIEIMRIAGLTKDQAKQGFSNMVDELWDAPPTPIPSTAA